MIRKALKKIGKVIGLYGEKSKMEKWSEKQIKEMARMRSRLILM